MAITHDYCLLIGRFKLQAKKIGIEVKSARMHDKDYADVVIEKAEASNDLEILVTCKKIKAMFS